MTINPPEQEQLDSPAVESRLTLEAKYAVEAELLAAEREGRKPKAKGLETDAVKYVSGGVVAQAKAAGMDAEKYNKPMGELHDDNSIHSQAPVADPVDEGKETDPENGTED